MTLPFSSEVLFALFGEYNEAIWPIPIFGYLIGIAILGMMMKPITGSDRLIAGLLAALWLWTGAIYHGQFLASIAFFAPVFALLFVAQASLFTWTGAIRGRLPFRLRRDAISAIAAGTMLYALIVYPLTNFMTGHDWPMMPVFGVTPAPLVIFTIGALLATGARTPWHLIALPVIWCLIGGSAVWLLDIPEDIALLIAGVGGMALIVWKNGRARRAATPTCPRASVSR